MSERRSEDFSWFDYREAKPHSAEADALFEGQLTLVWKRTDQLFGYLLVFQWVAAVLVATIVSPLAWEGRDSYIHPHVLFALIFGGILTLPPLLLIRLQPGASLTRHVVAACQALYSALFIHLSGGRIETHFHVFGSLAFLGFYRDNRVLVTASGVVLVDHFLRGMFLPQSVFGVVTASPWRAVEHTLWVVFEDFFLWIACRKTLMEMMTNANQEALIRQSTKEIESLVQLRTSQLKVSEVRYQVLCDTLPVGVFHLGADGQNLYVNGPWQEMFGLAGESAQPDAWLASVYERDREKVTTYWHNFLNDGKLADYTFRVAAPKLRWVRWQGRQIDELDSESGYVGAVEDINSRVMVEQRIRIQYAVSCVLARAQSVDEAITDILKVIVTEADWQVCDFWLVDPVAKVLNVQAVYCAADDELLYESFIAKCHSCSMGAGEGLPGRVWASRSPVFIESICDENDFPRREEALAAGLKCGAGFPVMVNEEVVGVIGFFCREERYFDGETQTVLAAIGTEIGRFMQRKKTEQALQASEKRFANILGLALDAFIMVDKDCRVSNWNTQAGRIFGYAEEEALGKPVEELIIPEDSRASYRKIWEDFVCKKHVNYRHRFEVNVARSHGREFPAEITILAHDTSNGHLEVAAFIRDLTEKQEHERVVNLLAAIVASSNDAIIGKSLDGRITSWNRAAEALFGYTALEAIGRYAIDLLVPSEKKEQIKALEMAVTTKGQTVSDIETQRVTKNGTVIDVSVSASPLMRENNKVDGMAVVYRDIRQRKELEKRMSEFYSIVSHELRTPLTSIRGALGLIVDEIIEYDSPEAKEMIGVALGSSERLVRLINDILDLKKIEAGKLELHLEARNSAEVVEKAALTMDGMARHANVTILTDTTISAPVMVDCDRITQVLTNLISNAIKYSPEGSSINISTELAAGNKLRISVTDEGIGIPEELQSLLFNKFQQIDSSDTRPKEGTGLGLALCKAVVEEHRGVIGVHSRPGAGSTFWFELPLAALPEELALALASKAGNGQILIVEDDDNLAQMLRLVLRKAGFASIRTSSKAETLLVIDAALPKVILLDLKLPDGNGLEILEYLRTKSPDGPAVPVIVMTGQEVDRANLPSPLVFDCFFKPLDLNRLLDCITRAVNFAAIKTVLLVEDDEDTRKVIAAQIRSIGASCAEASNGLQALALTDSIMPDLIILDVGLPKLNGFEVIEILQKGPHASVPLLVYSGRELTEGDRQKLTLGLTTYLTKGRVSPNEFVHCVQEIFKRLENYKQTAADNELAEASD
jgi:PAS domain S-box-containing protein